MGYDVDKQIYIIRNPAAIIKVGVLHLNFTLRSCCVQKWPA